MELTNIETSEQTSELYQAILQFQSRFINAPKDKKNEFIKNRYTTLEALNDYTRDHLQAAGLIIMQFPHTPDGCEKVTQEWSRGKDKAGNDRVLPGIMMTQAVTTRIVHAASGQFIQSTMRFIPEPGTGQTTYHATGAGLTYFKRQQFMSMLSIVGDEDMDGNAIQEPPRKEDKPAAAPGSTPTKDYSQLPGSPKNEKAATPPPAAQPPKQPEKPVEPPADGPEQEIDKARAEFEQALEEWVAQGVTREDLDATSKLLYDNMMLTAPDPDRWIADDFYIFMTRRDFEAAKRDWAAKGMTDAGVEEMAESLFTEKRVVTKKVDAMNLDDYQTLMEVMDKELGIETKG